MTDFYSTASAVKTRTGVNPEDLGLDTDADLTTFLEELLAEVSDLMNRRMRRDWLAEFDAGTITAIPKGLSGIAADITADAVREMVATRQTPVVRIDDFVVRTVTTKLFSKDVEKRLRLYSSAGLGTLTITPGDVAALPTSFSVTDLVTETP